MRKNSVLLLVLVCLSSSLSAQKTTVNLSGFTATTDMQYTTALAEIQFQKENLINQYEAQRYGEWLKHYGDKNTKSLEAAIQWLKQQKKTVKLTETVTDMSKPEQALAWFFQKSAGADFLRGGYAVVTSKKTKKKLTDIEYESGVETPVGVPYRFYFPGETVPFFTGDTNVEHGSIGTADVVFEEVGVESVEQVVSEPEGLSSESRIFTVVEQQPEYPGGYEKLGEYLKKNLQYPKAAVKDKIEGSVFVSFVVNTDGSLSDMQVVKGISPECDKEAVRLIQASGMWKPGKQNGKVVKARFVMPVRFSLEKK